jgi:hypothetical protein
MVKTPATGQIRITLPKFNNDDIFQIFGWKITDGVNAEPAAFSDKIMFLGQVAGRKIKNDSRGIQINLKLANMTELLLKTTRKWEIPTTNFPTVPEKIQFITNTINGMNRGVITIEFDAADYPTTTKGTPFTSFNYFKDDAPAFDVIHDLSRTEYTGDIVEYYSYIKPIGEKRYKLIWEPKTQTIDKNLVEGTDFDFIEFNNDKAEIVSAAIIVCGRDANNHAIRQMVYGDFKQGSRTKRFTSSITNDLFLYETSNNPADFDLNVDKFPQGFPYTTATEVSQDEVDAVIGTNYAAYLNATGQYIIANKSDFNKFIRYLSKARAIIDGTHFLTQNNYTRDKLIVRFYDTPSAHIPGETTKFTIYSIGWTGDGVNSYDYRKTLRLISKKIGVNKDGMFLDCEYGEDPRIDEIPRT